MSSESRLKMLVLDLMDSVEKIEVLVGNFVTKEEYSEEIEEIKLELAKISGQLSARQDINVSSNTTVDGDFQGNITQK